LSARRRPSPLPNRRTHRPYTPASLTVQQESAFFGRVVTVVAQFATGRPHPVTNPRFTQGDLLWGASVMINGWMRLSNFENSLRTFAVLAKHHRHDGNVVQKQFLHSCHGGDTMAFWQKKQTEFDDMAILLAAEPGLNANQIADRLGISPSTVTRRLPSMNDAGVYLSEDDRGRLYLFDNED